MCYDYVNIRPNIVHASLTSIASRLFGRETAIIIILIESVVDDFSTATYSYTRANIYFVRGLKVDKKYICIYTHTHQSALNLYIQCSLQLFKHSVCGDKRAHEHEDTS